MEAYSADTNTHYVDWDALIAAESNGYIVVGISERPKTAPDVVGPFSTKSEADKARNRLRRKWKREEAPYNVRCYTRIAWKAECR